MSYKLRFFLPLAVAITGLCLLTFASSQQVLRQSAYDPQIQIAIDTADALNSGATPTQIIGKRRVWVARSLAPFIIIFDKSASPTTSSAILNGSTPVPPAGVFTFTQRVGQDRITWQPAPNVRLATVVVNYKNGFVAVGRNMREMEQRTKKLLKNTIEGWLVILIGTFIATSIFLPNQKKK